MVLMIQVEDTNEPCDLAQNWRSIAAVRLPNY